MWSHEAIESPCNLTVLAVVDDAANERVIADRLAGRRFEVDFVPGLDRAVEALRRRPYDVLVVDLALPGEAGRSLLFRAQMLAPRLPVVLVTRHPDEELELHYALVRHRHLRRVRLRAGVGGAWFPLDGDTPDGLVQAAQVALEEARALGDGRCLLFRGCDRPPWPEDVIHAYRLPEPVGREVGDGPAGAHP